MCISKQRYEEHDSAFIVLASISDIRTTNLKGKEFGAGSSVLKIIGSLFKTLEYISYRQFRDKAS
jgi:hypothetical protein